MVALTEFEKSGDWSLTTHSHALTMQVQEETGAIVESIGKSYRGEDIYMVTVGEGDRVVFITGGVHRSEAGSHETVLIKMRDMAYNIGGKYSDLLSKYKYVFVPTVQVDIDTTRNNAQNLNINRDAYSLQTPEMAVLMKQVTLHDPDLYVDFHERSGTTERIEFINTMALDPNADSSVNQGSTVMMNNVRSELEELGYSTLLYNTNIIGPAMTVSAAGMLGSVTSTPETHVRADSDFRITALKATFDEILMWHDRNGDLINRIKQSYENISLNPNDRFILLNGSNEYYVNATKVPIITPEGYLLDEPNQFSLWIDTYGIEVDEDGFVPIKQKAGRLIPHLLDPQSDMRVASAIRIEPPEPEEPEKRTDGRYTKVLYDEWREVFIKYM